MIEEVYGSELDKDRRGIIDNENSQVRPLATIEKELNYQTLIEGLLYLVGEDGISAAQLASVLELTSGQVKQLLKVIAVKYEAKESALELVSFGGNYKFLTKEFIYPYAQRLFTTAKARSLSQSALETLAIIAYKQPITRVEIEELRGVSCEVMLRKLSARGLIAEEGRSEAPGRPILYAVTSDFLDSFKLTSLAELPALPEFAKGESTGLFD